MTESTTTSEPVAGIEAEVSPGIPAGVMPVAGSNVKPLKVSGGTSRAMKLLREIGYTENNIHLTLSEIFLIYRAALDMPFSEVQRLASKHTPEVPAILKAACAFIQHDVIKGHGTGIEQLLTRVYGRATAPENQNIVQQSTIIINQMPQDNETAQNVYSAIASLQQSPNPRDTAARRDAIGEDLQHNALSANNSA